jgi:phosphocarrier protein HPr
MAKQANAIAVIRNKLGLHARPAMMFVDVASTHRAAIRVKRADNDEAFDGKSIMQVMMLAATHGTKIEISAEGDDAETAVKALCDLIESGFAEE